MSGLLNRVAVYVGWSNETTLDYAHNAPRSYRRYYVDKKDGGLREILHPSYVTKALQYALMDICLSDLPVHQSAVAYRKGIQSPLRKNAEAHAPYAYSVRLDMCDFFPSIQPPDLFRILNLNKNSHESELDNNDYEFLKNALFVDSSTRLGRRQYLAIGAPTSPMISNCVMYDLDVIFAQFANANGGTYTRYADDLIYSTNKKGECNEFEQYVREIIDNADSPNLLLNGSKTRYLSRKGRRRITGLIVTPNGNVSIGRNRKRFVRKLLHEIRTDGISEKDAGYLQGMLSFILDVEPSLYNRLAQKYGADHVRAALNHEPSHQLG